MLSKYGYKYYIYTPTHTHTQTYHTHTHTYAYLLQSLRFKSPFQLCLFLPKPCWKMENTCMMDDEMGNNKIAHDHIYSRWEELDLGWLHRGNKMLEFKWCRGFTHMKTTKRILWMGDTLVEKGELEKKKGKRGWPHSKFITKSTRVKFLKFKKFLFISLRVIKHRMKS